MCIYNGKVLARKKDITGVFSGNYWFVTVLLEPRNVHVATGYNYIFDRALAILSVGELFQEIVLESPMAAFMSEERSGLSETKNLHAMHTLLPLKDASIQTLYMPQVTVVTQASIFHEDSQGE